MFGNRSRNFPAQVKRTITSKLTEKDRSPWTSPRVERSLTWLTHSSPDRGPNESDEAMRFELPMPVPTSVFTVAQTQTPGWDAPWSPSRLRQSRDVSFNPTTSPLRNNRRSHSMGTMDNSDESNGNGKPGRTQRNTSRRKQIRNFILNNSYVPLVSAPVSVIRALRYMQHIAFPCHQLVIHCRCFGCCRQDQTHRISDTSDGGSWKLSVRNISQILLLGDSSDHIK